MLLSKINEKDLSEKDINNILFNIPTDDGLTGSCIWVFGSPNDINERVQLAVELYKNNRAPYILFSGGKGKKGSVPEAQIMKEKAISLGVAEDAILTEEESNNTTENILCSMLVLERKFLLQNIERIVVVSSPFHIQRLSLTLSRYMPKWIKYSFCYNNNSPVSKENWNKNPNSKRRVEYEAQGIIFYAKNKYIDDKDIKFD